MTIICTGINSRDRELLTAYLASQGIPDEDLGAIVDECLSKAELYPQPRQPDYSDFATIAYRPGNWIVSIDRAYTAARS
jgi:hypothetical protein